MRHVVWIAVGLSIFSLSLFAVASVQRGRDQAALKQIATQTNDALCAFKTDLQRRYAAGAAFLNGHPDGIPGISRFDILQSLKNQKSTLTALKDLECP